MRFIHFFMIFLALPLLAALGLELYLLFTASSGAMLHKLGVVWAHYHPASLRALAKNMAPEFMPYLKIILERKLVVVSATPLAFFLFMRWFLKFIGLRRVRREPDSLDRSSRANQILNRKPRDPYKYKWK
jgi:hypothetical protein